MLSFPVKFWIPCILNVSSIVAHQFYKINDSKSRIETLEKTPIGS